MNKLELEYLVDFTLYRHLDQELASGSGTVDVSVGMFNRLPNYVSDVCRSRGFQVGPRRREICVRGVQLLYIPISIKYTGPS